MAVHDTALHYAVVRSTRNRLETAQLLTS